MEERRTRSLCALIHEGHEPERTRVATHKQARESDEEISRRTPTQRRRLTRVGDAQQIRLPSSSPTRMQDESTEADDEPWKEEASLREKAFRSEEASQTVWKWLLSTD